MASISALSALALLALVHAAGAWESDLLLSSATKADALQGEALSVQRFGVPVMRDGSPCTYNKQGVPMAPYCPGSRYNCVVRSLPNIQVQVYNGACNSKYKQASHCKFNKIPFAPGTANIRTNPLCQSCDCKIIASIPGKNKAACMCDALPPCYVDYSGKAVGRACPKNQNMCVVTRPGGGGKDRAGLPIDMGQCVYSGISALCATAGAKWGPKFYMKGVTGVPKANNRCTSCTCSATGRLVNCVTKRGCRHP